MPSPMRLLRNSIFYLIVVVSVTATIISLMVVLEFDRSAERPAELSAQQFRASMAAVRSLSERRQALALPPTDTAARDAAAADKSARGPALRELYDRQALAVSGWTAQRDLVMSQVAQAENAAILLYDLESGRPGLRAREKRFQQLQGWFTGQADSASAHLDSARVALMQASLGITAVRAATEADRPGRIAEARARLADVERLLAVAPAISQPPSNPAVGQTDSDRNRDVLGKAADWLRMQRSLELASLIGMVGFGLLGAAASTVVRRPQGAEGAQLSISDDLSKLLLSGVSAAFATYLAVKGGLAVASADGAQPNPYVLFLTCFVAAVYWEEAWERVRGLVRGDRTPEQQPATGENERVQDAAPATGAVAAGQAGVTADQEHTPATGGDQADGGTGSGPVQGTSGAPDEEKKVLVGNLPIQDEAALSEVPGSSG